VRNKTVLLAIGFVVLVIGMVVYSTMGAGRQKYRVEVCMQYQGRNACRTAASATEQQALRTAHENACAQIASGVTDTIQCEQYTQPITVKWLSR
jgi:hypothetical protein